ncbi:hypothetical protein HJC23_002306 [Cyclotella cryptica]|uniref:Uncharacterized protein n=1 Tax=Cyclotella cryptica TaxID=29204 RepID=A0ABD3QLP5_9STRA|eukprot:CCRYP_004379-RA/>CCRYP_004379-RA protein AED:0.41 eAED:0.44 QI:0/-1/0/1/-1/1/1/0/246
MSSSIASGFSSSRVGRNRKFNIDEKFANSPYLSQPIGSFHHEKKRRESSPRGDLKAKKSPRRRTGDSSDVESIITRGSVRSYRTNQTYRRPSAQNNTGRMTSMKSFLLPREVDKLLRGFRQKHSNHNVLTSRPRANSGCYPEDDNSTISSDFASSLDDEEVYKQCANDEQVNDAIFSGPLFAEIARRNSCRKFEVGKDVILPPVVPDLTSVIRVAVDKSGDVSDLESDHSVAERKEPRRPAGRKKR